MRFLDEDRDQVVNEIGIFLTMDEAKKLRDLLLSIIEKPDDNHIHLEEIDYEERKVSHEMTVSIYSDSNLRFYDQRSINLIRNNE